MRSRIASSLRLGLHDTDAVLLRQHSEVLGGEHLQEPDSREEGDEGSHDEDREERETEFRPVDARRLRAAREDVLRDQNRTTLSGLTRSAIRLTSGNTNGVRSVL